jgi:hypothetical protein
MPHDDEPAIEVEVIAIDGVTPAPHQTTGGAVGVHHSHDGSAPSHTWTAWQRWPSLARHLHPLWWPVLIVGGCILLVLILTTILVFGILAAIYRLIRGLLRALLE